MMEPTPSVYPSHRDMSSETEAPTIPSSEEVFRLDSHFQSLLSYDAGIV